MKWPAAPCVHVQASPFQQRKKNVQLFRVIRHSIFIFERPHIHAVCLYIHIFIYLMSCVDTFFRYLFVASYIAAIFVSTHDKRDMRAAERGRKVTGKDGCKKIVHQPIHGETQTANGWKKIYIIFFLISYCYVLWLGTVRMFIIFTNVKILRLLEL